MRSSRTPARPWFPVLVLVLVLALAALAFGCGGDDDDGNDDDDDDDDVVDVDAAPSTSECSGDLLGSCANNDGTGCVEIYGGGADPGQAETDCESDGNATWSTSTCDTGAAVGGCMIEQTTVCSITWLFPPITEEQLPLICDAGEVVEPRD